MADARRKRCEDKNNRKQQSEREKNMHAQAKQRPNAELLKETTRAEHKRKSMHRRGGKWVDAYWDHRAGLRACSNRKRRVKFVFCVTRTRTRTPGTGDWPRAVRCPWPPLLGPGRAAVSFGIAQAEACGAHEPCPLPSPVDLGSTRMCASVVVAVLKKRLLLLGLVRRGACNCGFLVSRTPPPSLMFGLWVSRR